MDEAANTTSQLAQLIIVSFISLAAVIGFAAAAHALLSLPMRRTERVRLFLNTLESAIKQGRPIEETLISLANSRDMSMGVRFHVLTAWLEQGVTLAEALEKTPRFLPPQVTATLLTGRSIGSLEKVIPACRQLLKDANSRVRGAINYLVVVTFVVTPLSIIVAWLFQYLVLPKLHEVAIGFPADWRNGLWFLPSAGNTFLIVQTTLLGLLWAAVVAYVWNSRTTGRMSLVQRFHYWIPWRRNRLQRDFSTLLAIMLDCGVGEAQALALAADSTVNTVFRHRAQRAVNNLKQGQKLTAAVASIDDSGEFAWRMSNAIHGGGFLRALAGWHESLDAKAFQQEQAAGHVITTALVIWTGVFVGAVAISVFGLLISIVDAGVLW